MPKIKFLANKPYSKHDSESTPLAASKKLPVWYTEYNRFAELEDGSKVLTWKACPAMYDSFSSGYLLRTPCDIEFFINDGVIDAKVIDKRYLDFLQKRVPLDGYIVPRGYHENHFAWYPDWSAIVPNGYSISYSTPANRFDLPFICVSGVVDNDKVDVPNPMPFFIHKEWTGILPAGTPFMQLVPFKRDNWKSEIVEQNDQEIYFRNYNNSMRFTQPGGGVYSRDVWSHRKYI